MGWTWPPEARPQAPDLRHSALTQDQVAMGDPTRGQKAPHNTALGIPGTHKPLHQYKGGPLTIPTWNSSLS